MFKLAVLPGDGIGPEVVGEALKVLDEVCKGSPDLKFDIQSYDFGGIAIDNHQHPLPPATLDGCKSAHAILLGAVGGPKWGTGKVRPEQGILGLRKALNLYANIRPALFPSDSLLQKSPIKEHLVKGALLAFDQKKKKLKASEGTEIIVLRELVGGIYFGERQEGDPKATEGDAALAWDRSDYSVSEIQRIARVAGALALKADPPHVVTSVDKANVLACSRLWRSVVSDLFAKEFPQLTLKHQLVDSAAMIICSKPTSLNGVLLSERLLNTGAQLLITKPADNLFGDILSDETSVIPGSLGLLPSASLSGMPDGKSIAQGLYEPIHGSAPDIAGKGIANPIGTILSIALMLRYSFNREKEAALVEAAVRKALDEKSAGGSEAWTADLGGSMSTQQVGEAVLDALRSLA